MSQIILHHYPQSPVAEKVRICLGIKQLEWHSVIIPRIPPKPDLMPLTGGYRRTPVMQIGAEIFCDSTRIITELEKRYPTHSLFPSNRRGLDLAIGRWTDTELFKQMIGIVLGAAHDSLPAEFAQDRGRLYFGPDHDLAKVASQLPTLISQVSAQLALIDSQLENSPYISGATPGYLDAVCHYLIWFLHGRFSDGPKLIAQFTALENWRNRMNSIGHGSEVTMKPADALKVGSTHDANTHFDVNANNPESLCENQLVNVTPDGDGGDPAVSGKLSQLTHETISIIRQHEQLGAMTVHFPRIGYIATPFI